jgi:hypothetical protein
MQADLPPLAVPAQVRPCEPDVLCAVVRTTARLGWPHAPQDVEMVAIMRRVLREQAAGRRAGVACSWRGTLGRTVCGVAYRTDGRLVSFRVLARVWEDGSYRFSRLGGK